MRRLLAIAATLAVVAAAWLAGTGAGDDDGGDYLVRAIFENAGFVIEGEDVKVAGVVVGAVDSLDVTREDRAAIVLRIDDPAYHDFRADAQCRVRPQSLIGERFVECEPTQKRAPGAPAAPPLERVASGSAEGQHLLPVEQTSKVVDLDQINNIMRLPYRQRFSIILNEFGTALAGRGEDLRTVIRRADPALREIDEVLEILADQNETLVRLAEDSDRALAPLARERSRVSGFISSSGRVARATAERRTDLERTFERLPRFLAELTPTMERLGALSDQATPVFADLGDGATEINQVVTRLGPFARAATPAFETLGDALVVGRPALERSRPVVGDLRALAQAARPAGADLSAVLGSFRRTGGIERLMDLVYFQVAAINGYDSFGHYLRARLLVNNCSNYTPTPISGCLATFRPPESDDSETATVAGGLPSGAEGTVPAIPEGAEAPVSGEAGPAAAAPAPAPTPTPTPAPAASPAPGQRGVLDYLLGQESE